MSGVFLAWTGCTGTRKQTLNAPGNGGTPPQTATPVLNPTVTPPPAVGTGPKPPGSPPLKPTGPQKPGPPQPAQPSPVAAAQPPSLVGSWTGNCNVKTTTVQGATTSQYSQATVVFTATDVTVNDTVYLSAGCSQPSSTTIIVSTYTTAAASSGAPPQTYNLDYTLVSVNLVYHDAPSIGELDDTSFCGVANWSVETPVNITGLSCFENQPPLAKAGTVLYDIYEVIGNQATFGLTVDAEKGETTGTYDGTTEAKRPQTLNSDSVLTRSN